MTPRIVVRRTEDPDAVRLEIRNREGYLVAWCSLGGIMNIPTLRGCCAILKLLWALGDGSELQPNVHAACYEVLNPDGELLISVPFGGIKGADHKPLCK